MGSYFNKKRGQDEQRTVWPGILVAMALCFTSFSVHAQLSGTYTVCASGCDYSSVKAAANDLNSKGVKGAVTFNIAAGNYNETGIQINNISGASSTNTITFKGAGKTRTRIYTSSSGNMFYLYYSQWVNIEDLTIESTASSTSYVYRPYYAKNCSLTNCRIIAPAYTGTTHYPVYDYYNYRMTYENNDISGGYYGVYIYGYGSASYGELKFLNNKVTQFYYYGMYNYQYYSNGQCVIDGNYFDSAAYAYSSCIMDYYDNGSTITNNRLGLDYNCGYGLRVYYPNYYGNNTSKQVKVYNNFVSGQYYPMYLYLYYLTSSTPVMISHNTVHNNYGNPTYGTYMYQYYCSGGLEFTNNSITRSNSGYTLYVYQYNGSAFDKLDGNNYFDGNGPNINFNGTVYTDINSYKKATGDNASSVALPFKTSGDFHLDQSKPAPGGIASGITVDIDGDTRCKLFPTAGADESNFGKSKPVVKIYGNSTVVSGSPTVFYNSAQAGEPKIHKWYIDGVYQSDSIHLETTKLTGPTNTIKLVTEGCGGKDSATLTVTVTLPTKAPVSDFIADKNTVLQNTIISFYDLSSNGPSQWIWSIKPDSTYSFGLKVPTVKLVYGDLKSPKWQGRFDYPGKYQICLQANNLAGKGNTECKTDYIDVLPTVLASGTMTIRYPSGYLYDDGGPNGTYAATNSVHKILIDPCASEVKLVINYFDTECGYDYLTMYDGTSAKDSALHKKCAPNGFNGGPSSSCVQTCLPSKNDTFVATSGKLYIEFFSDPYVSYNGFEMYWWSTPKASTKPVAGFSSIDTICTNGVVNFTNTSTGTDVSYQWDLDGDPSFFEATTKNTTWPYFFPGQYTVTLLAENCGGVDTFQKTITVLDPPTPKPDFKADNTTPTTNDIVYLNSTTAECVDNYEWEFTKKYGTGTVTFANGTSKKSLIPQVVFPDTGLWSVQLKATNVTGSGTKTRTDYINVKGSYCNPSVSNTLADIGISKVVFNEINNSTSQGIDAYQNFTPTISTTIEIGVKYPLTLERTSNKNKANRTVWIDWNGDGDFNDAQEKVDEENNSSALSWTTDITVPSFATVGATKMRLAINQSNYANKVCGQNEFGEYEDYRIYITADLTPPVITRKGADTVIVEQGFAYVDSGATAKDNLDGDITANIKLTSAPTFNALIPGAYIFSYNVEDNAGNKAETRKRVVIIEGDKTPPALRIAKPDTVTLAVNEPYAQPKILSADDLVDGDMTSYISINDPVNPAVAGMYKVTFTVSDFSNNDTTVIRYVNVIDSIKPSITLIGQDTVLHDVNTPYTDSGVVMSDNYYANADLNASMVTSNNVDITKLGVYVVNYTLTDPSGNGPVTAQRVVKVVDREAPVLTIIGMDPVTIDVYDQYLDLGISISDNYYTLNSWDTSGTFYTAFPDGMTNKLGTYTVIYDVTDGSGNMASITRTIEVVDRIAPEGALLGAPTVIICRWAEYADAGYDLSDNYWANADIDVTKEGNFITGGGTDLPGLYSFRYKFTDRSGNVSYSEYRYIFVHSEFEGDCVTGIAENAEGRSLNIYPNPNSGKFNVTTSLPASDRVRISVTNTLGQEVALISNGSFGSNTFTVDMCEQAAGIYFVKIASSGYVITRQVVINK